MNLRLAIAVGPDNAVTFEHAGPVVRIGRDADCELSLQGEASTAVSRRHARIELSAAGATLTDTGSSNGTLLNGRLLDGAAPLRLGDEIQMGHTGATLTVLELDLTTPPAVDAHRAVRIGSVAAVAVAAVVVVAVVLRNKPKKDEEPTPSPPPVALSTPALSEMSRPLLPPPSPDPGRQPSLSAVKPATGEGTPSEEVKPVGSYVALDRWVSVLLQRQAEAHPWAVLRPESRVSTATTLVSLPGYRSLLALDAGLHLTVWGNLPEFSAFPPVLESVVMLHAPAPGVDLDFTLDRGRVLVANRKPAAGPARVRLRFLREVWDLELPDAKSEVALELWSPPPTAPSGPTPQPSVHCLGLFTKGRAGVRTPRQNLDLGDRSRLSWVSQEPAALHPANLTELPVWWAKPPERTAPEVQKALRSLLDWRDLLGGSSADPSKRAEPVVATIKTQVEEVKDPDNQDVGVFFLAALDELEPLVELLKDPNANVRGVTLFALQTWLSRGSRHAGELAWLLQRRGDSRERAERVVRLLHVLPAEALDQRQTYEELVASLDDDNKVVRNLAFWQLDRLGAGGRLPEEAKDIRYEPTWDAKERRPAVERWRTLLRSGKVPAPPPRG
jgi:FHA domain